VKVASSSSVAMSVTIALDSSVPMLPQEYDSITPSLIVTRLTRNATWFGASSMPMLAASMAPRPT
jgi:hypothetical protein